MDLDVIFTNFEYFMIGSFPEGPLGGVALSIILAVVGIAGASVLGLIIGLMRMSKSRLIRYPAMVYIEVVRGTPLLMLMFWFYFLMPVLLGQTLYEPHSAAITLIVFTAAYVAEIVRAGVEALPKGQMEAARASGLNKYMAMRYVVLPQALRNMIPSFVNQFVSLTKDTSLAYVIGVTELTRAVVQVNNRTLTAPMELYGFLLVFYFIICYPLTAGSRMLERRMSRYQARG